MAATNPQTVFLGSADGSNPAVHEAQAAATLTPGKLVKFDSNDKIALQGAIADHTDYPVYFCDKNRMVGGSLTTTIATNETIQALQGRPGDSFYALIAPSSPAVAAGSLLIPAASGDLAPTASNKVARFEALEAVDNSGNPASVRIKVRVT